MKKKTSSLFLFVTIYRNYFGNIFVKFPLECVFSLGQKYKENSLGFFGSPELVIVKVCRCAVSKPIYNKKMLFQILLEYALVADFAQHEASRLRARMYMQGCKIGVFPNNMFRHLYEFSFVV